MKRTVGYVALGFLMWSVALLAWAVAGGEFAVGLALGFLACYGAMKLEHHQAVRRLSCWLDD